MSDNPGGLTPEQIEFNRIAKILKSHQSEMRQYMSYRTVSDGVEQLLAHYRNIAEDSVIGMRSFRDDLIIWLRAMAMTVEMTGNAGTHREKDARLRGVAELIESVISKLHDETFDTQFSRHYWRTNDLFHTDFPVRQFKDRAHEAEKAKGEAESVSQRLKLAIASMPEAIQQEIAAKLEHFDQRR